MRLIRMLALIALQAIVIGLALDVLLSGVLTMGNRPLTHSLPVWLQPNNRLTLKLFWSAALLVPLLYWIAAAASWKQRRRSIAVLSSDGEVMLLHPAALHKFVRHQIETHPAVVSHKVDVRESGNKGIAISAVVNVEPIASLNAIKNDLQRSIRDGLEQVMGISKIDDIRIVLGLDEKSITRRPGPERRPKARIEPPMRARRAAEATPAPSPPPASPAPPVSEESGVIPMREVEETPAERDAAHGFGPPIEGDLPRPGSPADETTDKLSHDALRPDEARADAESPDQRP
ncbi:MAG TPA: alkaline shock response membrane anchor protein AmaP [Candidatus Sumerlaeota bacterium]|nr:alkaline shock response membrane anchor protein AmaP [Candidatus Sumerlaeota bacterium]HPK04060.1 alkaline shock response membrane anchor protein AmaP [Candidatus Sumerlaeota bacterium]